MQKFNKQRILKNPLLLMQKHFLTGVFVIIPIGVIVWLAGIVIGIIWDMQYMLPDIWQPQRFSARLVFAAGCTTVLAIGISLLGWASKQIIGKKILILLGELIQHIPVLRSIYSALDQLLKTMTDKESGQFSRVVYIEYPRKGLWVIAFVTGPARGAAVPPGHINIYVPTTPNPTSGFHLIVPESEVKDSHMTVEEAFKTLLSLGIAQSNPGSRP
ncbi:MAG: hypothetical protein A2583_16795 [Bdellovibrionales bacterium RIFOXYD1_FULL_53_11]|nr:MAG: hypothetical protein A2583_16795 [Bdellovibrionales bacterium RIFOXYD1_FULL_53_11]